MREMICSTRPKRYTVVQMSTRHKKVLVVEYKVKSYDMSVDTKYLRYHKLHLGATIKDTHPA